MGIFTMCPACGSDWCCGCECVKERYEVELKRISKEMRLEAHDIVRLRLHDKLYRWADALEALTTSK